MLMAAKSVNTDIMDLLEENMKKFIVILAAIALATSMAFTVSAFSPKKVACEKACKEALQKCKKETKKDEVKRAACKVAYKECLADCEKKE